MHELTPSLLHRATLIASLVIVAACASGTGLGERRQIDSGVAEDGSVADGGFVPGPDGGDEDAGGMPDTMVDSGLPDGGLPDGADTAPPPATCTDSERNELETDVDCGGGSCPACADHRRCLAPNDCASGVCTAGMCAVASCLDRVRNGTETDVDCGGGCVPCPTAGTCAVASDCVSGVCTAARCVVASCSDGVLSGSETDTDCGGASCAPCGSGRACAASSDCASGFCNAAYSCAAPSCADGELNGTETDTDCGGVSCAPCVNGGLCEGHSDCASETCTGGRCVPPTCFDGRQNGGESDVDCGGSSACARCLDGRSCALGTDCVSTHCEGAQCAEAPIVFAGWTRWTQNAFSQSDVQQDRIMIMACASAFTGSRPATTDEVIGRRVVGLPPSNTSSYWFVPTCPSCAGIPSTSCPSGHGRVCVAPGSTFPGSLPWTGDTGCFNGERSAMCVR